MDTSQNTVSPPSPDLRFVKRVLIVLGLIALAYFVYLVSTVLLLVFASVLLAVIFNALSRLFHDYLGLRWRFSLTAAVLTIIVLIAGVIFAFGALLGTQLQAVAEALPSAIDNVGTFLGIEQASTKLDETVRESMSASSILPRAAGVGYVVIGALANIALVAVAGVYFAADPAVYKNGVAKMLPRDRHALVMDTMDTVGHALGLWLQGQLVVMLIVGVLSGLGYWWLGLPAPLALALIAGITNFIPYVGPFLGAAPAVVFALNVDLATVAWTVGVVFLVQQIESNLVTPLVQRKTVSLPPALALFAIVVCGVLFGILGVLLAVPITVAAFVAVKKLYVREALGRDTEVPGEEGHEQA
ncbi:MAG TPA: AI-2E family transporter [Beijerinckiaceae bacterium]|jgi:predicted PurR-regulated permease PerM